MATTTSNYGLVKPDPSDFYDIGVFNSNADAIDAQMKQNADNIGTKQDALSWDNSPVENSTKPVKSGGLFDEFSAVKKEYRQMIDKNTVLTWDSSGMPTRTVETDEEGKVHTANFTWNADGDIQAVAETLTDVDGSTVVSTKATGFTYDSEKNITAVNEEVS